MYVDVLIPVPTPVIITETYQVTKNYQKKYGN